MQSNTSTAMPSAEQQFLSAAQPGSLPHHGTAPLVAGVPTTTNFVSTTGMTTTAPTMLAGAVATEVPVHDGHHHYGPPPKIASAPLAAAPLAAGNMTTGQTITTMPMTTTTTTTGHSSLLHQDTATTDKTLLKEREKEQHRLAKEQEKLNKERAKEAKMHEKEHLKAEKQHEKELKKAEKDHIKEQELHAKEQEKLAKQHHKEELKAAKHGHTTTTTQPIAPTALPLTTGAPLGAVLASEHGNSLLSEGQSAAVDIAKQQQLATQPMVYQQPVGTINMADPPRHVM